MAQTNEAQSRSAQLRSELGHPVVDGDGHIVELMPVFLDFVRDHGQGKLLQAMLNRGRRIEDLSMEERRQGGVLPHSWHVPTSTEYYANGDVTTAVPRADRRSRH